MKTTEFICLRITVEKLVLSVPRSEYLMVIGCYNERPNWLRTLCHVTPDVVCLFTCGESNILTNEDAH